ncbi:histidine kinase dimerization/phosphoacceptor domain -containing protein [Algoriphagus sp. AGSA1]|uniref:tetratricopeptide repeat-containing sensor histidine kinase n=1 Tax=Algoriphagus sp. AGSA1 TaxID=2907213 RepID=UPI001F2ED08B|nr:histidine kinase dimerization/phosphoacceptor domain -containing protein [Algoriphagus sp. AGSA1]
MLSKSKPDTNQVKLYLQLGKYHLYKPGELQADMDSAFAYATKAQDLSRSLSFSQGKESSQLLLAQIYLKTKRINQLRILLEKMKPDEKKTDLLYSIGEYYLFKPLELPVDLDSATYFAQSALNLQIQRQDVAGQARSLALLAHINKERGVLPMATKYQQKSILLIEKVTDLSLQAALWVRLGNSYTRSEESMPHRIRCYEKAVALYRELGNKEKEASTLRTIADMRRSQGDFAQSLRVLLEVLQIQKSIGSQELQYTYEKLGHVHKVVGNFEQALPYALESIKEARASGDTVNINSFYFLVLQIYEDMGQPQQALQLSQELIRMHKDSPHNWIFNQAHIHAGRAMVALNQPREALSIMGKISPKYQLENPVTTIYINIVLGEIYMAMKDYPNAEKHLLKASLDCNGASGPIDYCIAKATLLAKLYSKTGQYQKAQYHLEQAFALTENYPRLLQISNLHLYAFQLDSLRGNLSSAIGHYQQYKALQDSVFNERKSNQLIAFQVQYETEKKEQELQLKEQNITTLTQERQLQQQEIKQAKLLRNGITGGAAMLLMLLGVIYNRYRLKQQSNRQLQSQQVKLQEQQQQIQEKNHALEQLLEEKERLLKEIHHRVKNNLQIVMSLLNSQVASLKDKAALSAIQDSQNRVQAMALIHQKLYQNEGLARIPMKGYVEEVVTYLQDTFALSRQVGFKLVIEPIELDVNLAVPLGLIINEAITNAFKYAFPEGRAGLVLISLQQKADTSYELIIEDDGVGLPKEFDPSQIRSLGMTLIHGFSAQLGAELHIESSQGVKISLLFADEKISPIHNKVDYAN